MRLCPLPLFVLVALVAAPPGADDAPKEKEKPDYLLGRVEACGHQSPCKEGDLVAINPRGEHELVKAGSKKNDAGETVTLALVPLGAIMAKLQAEPPPKAHQPKA